MLYCPNEAMLEEARNISKLNFMQIQVGDSGATADLNFDRSSVCVVEIPESRFLEYKPKVTKGLHQIFNYHNDFIIMDKTLTAVVDGEKFTPTMLEKHYAKFVFPMNKSGEFIALILFDKEVLESVTFNVD